MKSVFFKLFVLLVSPVLLLPNPVSALISEERPGVPYFDQVLFLQKKVIENGKVVAASLAYTDPRDNIELCLNRIDVFGGLDKFHDVPEKKWVLVDFELQSLLIAEGFAGDADVSWVTGCPDVDTCLKWSEERGKTQKEIERRATFPRPKATVKANPEDISERLELGRKLVKAARCRGCHNLEGAGPEYAPSLTWKRVKYEKNWLKTYLKAPYRMRPAMDNLMMPKYTSPNAVPSLQQAELDVVADYLEHAGVSSAPANDQHRELWEDYDCFGCHVKQYKSDPLVFQPTPVPKKTKTMIKDSPIMQSCLGCHSFGDMHTINTLPIDHVNAFAPDLLLSFEKLNLDFISSFLAKPAYLVPLTKMPNLGLNDDQILEIRNIAEQTKEAIATGKIKPKHIYYKMKKKSRE